MRTRIIALIAVAGTAMAGLALVSPAGATAAAPAAPYCGITWGSLAKSDPTFSQAPLTDVRGGRHDCYDRLVFDLAGPAAGYTVQYVSQVTQQATGDPVPLRGGAFLEIVLKAPAYDQNGNPTYSPRHPNELVRVGRYRTFRQVAWAGTFEGYTSVGLGVRARLPFRVFQLAGPGSGSRVVVDVAHSW